MTGGGKTCWIGKIASCVKQQIIAGRPGGVSDQHTASI